MSDPPPKTLSVSLQEWADLLDPLDASDLLDLEDSLFGSDFGSDSEDDDEAFDENKNKFESLNSVKPSESGVKRKQRGINSSKYSGPMPTKASKRRQRPKKRSAASIARNSFKKAKRFVKNMMADAKKNTVELKNVCIQELLKQPTTVDDPIPDTWLELGHDPTASTVVSTLVVDKNGIPLIAHLPRFLPEHSHNYVYKVLTNFGHTVEKYLSLGGGADRSGRNAKSCYREQPGEIAGCINVACWHALAHTATEAIFSRDQLKTSSSYSSCADVVYQLRSISYKLNEILRILDPEAYKAHRLLRKKLKSLYPHVRARSSIDPFLFQGRSFIYNRQTPNHLDKRDPRIGWTPLFVTGEFVGGWLRIRKLGVKMWFGPGACAWIRGGLFQHEVEPFTGGQRISVASFMHQSVWDTAGIQPRTTGIHYDCPASPESTEGPADPPEPAKTKTRRKKSSVKPISVNGLRRTSRIIKPPTRLYD